MRMSVWAKRAGLLHDIGKAVDMIWKVLISSWVWNCVESTKESPLVINAVEAHHGDVEPESLIACLVQAADTISAARRVRKRNFGNILKPLTAA